MTNLVKYKIYFPEEPNIEGAAEKIEVNSKGNPFTIMANHAPLVATIKDGSFKIHEEKEIKEFKFNDGFVNVKKDVVVLDIIK